MMVPASFRLCSRRSIVKTIGEKQIPECNVKDFEQIPGPKPLPLVGNLWRYMPIIGEYSFKKIHRTYAQLYKQYGPLVREKMFFNRTLVHVYDPMDMATVYRNESKRPRRMSHTALARYRRERPHLYSGPGLFPSNGDEWYKFRRLFQRILVPPTTADNCSPQLEAVTDDLIERIPHLLDENGETDLQPLLFNWALECIGVITLNRRLGCLTAKGNKEATSLIQAANDIHQAVYITENSPFKNGSSYRKLEAGMDLLSSVVDKYILEALAEKESSENEGALLFRMMKAEGADRKDVFTMILDMFLAGIDTTAYSLAFALYNLSINRDVQETLRSELRERLPDSSCKFSDVRSKMPYLQNVIKETLRVNPVAVGNGRILPTDLILSGYHVPANTLVIIQHQVASMQEQYFKCPHKFLPDRWLGENPPLVSSPFGNGPRMCIGMRLAQKELQLSIAKMVLNFDMSYHHEPIDSCNRLINVPDKPLRLRLRPQKW